MYMLSRPIFLPFFPHPNRKRRELEEEVMYIRTPCDTAGPVHLYFSQKVLSLLEERGWWLKRVETAEIFDILLSCSSSSE